MMVLNYEDLDTYRDTTLSIIFTTVTIYMEIYAAFLLNLVAGHYILFSYPSNRAIIAMYNFLPGEISVSSQFYISMVWSIAALIVVMQAVAHVCIQCSFQLYCLEEILVQWCFPIQMHMVIAIQFMLDKFQVLEENMILHLQLLTKKLNGICRHLMDSLWDFNLYILSMHKHADFCRSTSNSCNWTRQTDKPRYFLCTSVMLFALIGGASTSDMNICENANITITASPDYYAIDGILTINEHTNIYLPCNYIHNGKQQDEDLLPFWQIYKNTSSDIDREGSFYFIGLLPADHQYNGTGLIIRDVQMSLHASVYLCCFDTVRGGGLCESESVTISVILATNMDEIITAASTNSAKYYIFNGSSKILITIIVIFRIFVHGIFM